MSCDFCVHHIPYTQGRDGFFQVTDDEPFESMTEICPFWRWILMLLELGLQNRYDENLWLFLLWFVFFHFHLAFFLTGRWQHQIPSKSIKRGVRFIPEYVRVQEHAILEPNPTSADTVNIPWTTVIWHDWSQLVQDFVQPLMLHLPSSSKNDLLMSIESQDSNYIPFPKTNSKVLKIGPLPQKVSGIYSQVRTLCFRVWIGKTLPPFLSQ